MKSGRMLLYVALIAVGAIGGFLGSSYLSERGFREAAKANLFAAGESLRKGDTVAAMNSAQAAVSNAPYAYDPYEAVGDVYLKLGHPTAAKTMYEKAIDRLSSGGVKAMLVEASSPDTVMKLLRQKLDAVPASAEQPRNSPSSG